MSIEHSPEHNIAYQFVCYDARGRERAGEHGLASDQLLAAGREHPTDIFVFSHGWNGDPKAALGQYGRWVDTMATRTGDRDRLHTRVGGFRPSSWACTGRAKHGQTRNSPACPMQYATTSPR